MSIVKISPKIGPGAPVGPFQMRRRAGDVAAALKPDAVPGVALVPLEATAERLRVATGHGRPDPSFVAQLIATAQQSPQTRVLRRATPTETLAAYRTTVHQNQSAEIVPGDRTWKTA